MDWKQIVAPRRLRLGLKWSRRLRAVLFRPALTGLLALGLPRPMAAYLRARGARGRVVLYKQGILSVAAGQRFLRYASSRGGNAKLQREFNIWGRMREMGLGPILARDILLRQFGPNLLLDAELLYPIALAEQMAMSLPIVHALAGAARPTSRQQLPASIDAGLRFVRLVSGGTLPGSFASEEAIRAAFGQPLRTGVSHCDLHHLNVMRDSSGRPVLIDLKSCAYEQVLALDLLNFACRYLTARNRQNLVENAFALQRCGWRLPAIEPLLTLIDLPRALWGPITTLHIVGRFASKGKSGAAPNPILGALLQRLFSRDWRPGTAEGCIGGTQRVEAVAARLEAP
ncbi:MAG TPA: hypothetical protein VED46_11995 [Alphaproteobacteria bacterium]|nr:hypothetical protein [Alphaproteobacteria bacterium]